MSEVLLYFIIGFRFYSNLCIEELYWICALFSCFSGYKCFKGQVLNADDMECLYDGLKQNNIHGQFSHMITGMYTSLSSFMIIIIKLSHM